MNKFEEKYLKVKYEFFFKNISNRSRREKNKNYYETKSKWFSHSDI